MNQLLNLGFGALYYLVFAGIGGFVGYHFARKQTEHEVGYRRRVEVVERLQGLVISIVEEFEQALEYVRAPGPGGELPVKEIERSVDELERYCVRQEIWLDRSTFAKLGALTEGFRARHRELKLLPRHYGDPDFDRDHERVGAELEHWLRAELPRAREELADSFRRMLGVGRWRFGALRRP